MYRDTAVSRVVNCNILYILSWSKRITSTILMQGISTEKLGSKVFESQKDKNNTFSVQGYLQWSLFSFIDYLTHWGRVTHICVSKQTIIGSDNGLSPGWRQAIIWTNAGLLLIETLGTNFSEILIKIWIFSFKKMGLKVSSAKWRPFCLCLNVLTLSFTLECAPMPLLIKWKDILAPDHKKYGSCEIPFCVVTLKVVSQQCCWVTHRLSKWYDNFNTQLHTLVIRHDIV